MAVAKGRRLGVDVGRVRIGVAVSDPDGILATPLATVPRDESGWAAFTQAQATAAPAALPSDIAALARSVAR